MNIIPINSTIVFSSKRKEAQKSKRLEKKESQKPYNRYQQKEAQIRAEHLQSLGINVVKPRSASNTEFPRNSYNRKGKLISSINKLEDGTLISKHYDGKGKMEYATKYSPSGKISQWYFDKNGVIISWDEKKPNGDRLTHYYDENGNMFALVSKNSKETHVRRYNDEGKLIREIFLSQDGEMTTASYDQGENKNETLLEILYPDGSSKSLLTKLIENTDYLPQDIPNA